MCADPEKFVERGPSREPCQRPGRRYPRAVNRIFTVPFASVYPHHVAKAEKKGRTKDEVDQVIRWLTLR